MPLTVNERLLRDAIAHAIDLQRYSNTVVKKIITVLNQSDNDLMIQIRSALSRLPVMSFTVQRLDQLLESSRRVTAFAMQQVGLRLMSELKELVNYESWYQEQGMRKVLPPVIASSSVNQVNVEQVYAAVASNPLQGRLLSEWHNDLSVRRSTLIRDQLRMGYMQQQTLDQMAQRIRGTRANSYTDGVLQISRREVETLVRTATANTASVTRDNLYKDNEGLVRRLRWVATLDTRTSHICRMRDGKEYDANTYKPIGHQLSWLGGPGNAHWGCRSVSIPVLKSWRELGMDMEEMSPEERASMDGTVAGDLTYGQWLTEQSADRQDEVLGPARGALLRKGGMKFEQFSNRKGDWLTLAQLKRKNSEAFSKAGV